MDGWMDGWVDGWKDGWMDGWSNSWVCFIKNAVDRLGNSGHRATCGINH